MNEQNAPTPPRRSRGLVVGLVGAGIVAGAIGATAFGASAVTSASTTAGSGSSNSSSTSATIGSARASTQPAHTPRGVPGHGQGRPDGPMGGSMPVRADEKAVSAADTAKIKAAALKAVPGGTVYRIETDSGDGVYEAHMTKADGSPVTVKFDKSLAVTKVEAGMGT